MIPPLTCFTVLPEYGRSWTVYDVVPKGESAPALRLRKESRYDSRQPFHAFSGPQLDELEGYVTVGAAMGADRGKHGTIGHRNGSALRAEEWSFAQVGLPVLEGEPVGASALRHSFPLRAVLANGVADSALSFRLRYRGPGSAGFEFTRLAGVRARYAVEVHDERLSRLLVLAAVLRHSVFSDSDVRQYRVDLTTNPLKD